MNLLLDAWIPITHKGSFKLITYERLLCEDEDWQISLPRDDLELACLQLLVCLTQVAFLPKDKKNLLDNIRTPLTHKEYLKGISPFINWFDLLHPDIPFMQIRGVKAKEDTPIQKLFVGLPEGNNHAFFNKPGEINVASLSVVAIALFNQACSCPSFGGGFKGGLRGGAPVTSLVRFDRPAEKGRNADFGHLRRMIWFNVLHWGSLQKEISAYNNMDYKAFLSKRDRDKPTWVAPIKQGETISAQQIGLLRGLFWQPAHIELKILREVTKCDVYGIEIEQAVTGFSKEKFTFTVAGMWPHFHSASYWYLKNNIKEEKFLSFTKAAPAWTQLTQFVIEEKSEKAGQKPAAVVSQFKELSQGRFPLEMIVGGYRNKQASILQRRHEFFCISTGWDQHQNQLKQFVGVALDAKNLIRNKMYGFGKSTGVTGIQDMAENFFYYRSEPLVHEFLRLMDWRQSRKATKKFIKELSQIGMTIFEELTKPYQHQPKMILALVKARSGLERGFKKLYGGDVV